MRVAYIRLLASLGVACLLVSTESADAQLTFNFTAASGTPQQVIDGFVQAGDLWSDSFDDPVAVDLDINFSSQGQILGITTPTLGNEPYAAFTSALLGDATSAADFSAVGSLQGGSSYDVWINRTFENGGSATPYLDNNNSENNQNILYTSANARAVGISTPGVTSDAVIGISSDVSWDFDPSDGITAGSYDFVGVAAHEIGHALGFYSRVDSIDLTPGLTEDVYWSTPIDLFRYSNDSLAEGVGVNDMTANANAKFFSIDGGQTIAGNFSTGALFGDGFGASHWEVGEVGLMIPGIQPGQLLEFSALDHTIFDVTGWDRVTVVPEPGFGGGLFVAMAVIGLFRKPRKQ